MAVGDNAIGERFGLQQLPGGASYDFIKNDNLTEEGKKITFDAENDEHIRIRKDNMSNIYISSYEEAKKLGFSNEKAKFTATMLTGMAGHESDYGFKKTGTNNVFGRKASPSQMKAGKGYNVGTHEIIDGKRVDSREPFLNFDSFQDSIKNQIEYLEGKFPGSLDAKNTHDFVMKLQGFHNDGDTRFVKKNKEGKTVYRNPKYYYATDSLSLTGNGLEAAMETDPLKNQYTIKLNNFIGHGWTNYNETRPDMSINKIGKREMYEPSDAFRRNGKKIAHQGITGPESKLIDMNYVTNVLSGKINRKKIQKETSILDKENGFLSHFTESF